MKRAIKFLTLVIVLVLCASWAVQPDDDFDFDDMSGNFITLKEYRKLPAPLDTTFIKSVIRGSLFNKEEKNGLRFHYIIELKGTKQKNEYALRVSAIPRTRDVAEVLKYQGWKNYTMVVKDVKGQPGLKTVKFLSAEI